MAEILNYCTPHKKDAKFGNTVVMMDHKRIQAEVDSIYADLPDQPQHSESQVAVIKTVIELYLVTFKYYYFDRTRELVHERYKQHNTQVGDGRESIIDFAKILREGAAPNWNKPDEEPRAEMYYNHILVDGEFITVHLHAVRWTGDRGADVIDLFRFKGGMFVEHWDIVAEVPPASEIKSSGA